MSSDIPNNIHFSIPIPKKKPTPKANAAGIFVGNRIPKIQEQKPEIPEQKASKSELLTKPKMQESSFLRLLKRRQKGDPMPELAQEDDSTIPIEGLGETILRKQGWIPKSERTDREI